MKKMFVLMSHQMTQTQYNDARSSYDVEQFVELDNKDWSNIPADTDSISLYLETLKHNILQDAQLNDLLLVQGDFGATVAMVHFAHEQGIVPVYATTQRIARDIVNGDRVTTIRTFEHVRFRIYERG